MDERIAKKLLVDLEIAHFNFQRREAMAWLVMCYDTSLEVSEETDGIVGAYGPFGSPEEALVECGKHDNASLPDFKNVVIPLYPPVVWKDEK
jgi:hypothetical protein